MSSLNSQKVLNQTSLERPLLKDSDPTGPYILDKDLIIVNFDKTL
jgi:hypothetical protein